MKPADGYSDRDEFPDQQPKAPRSEHPPSSNPPSGPNPKFLASEQLLFGIVALQNDLLTREQFIAAFDAWVHDKSRTLADVLQSQGTLNAEICGKVGRRVARSLQKHNGNADRMLNSLGSLAPLRPELERLLDPDLNACLRRLSAAAKPSADVSMNTLLTERRDLLGRFLILRPHARGGLGQVSVARDQELNREVALKQILRQHANNSSLRERFILEAEITGGLEHPGIVPVYALGKDAEGNPFYAMRFVKGDTLETAIDAYHDPDNSNRKDAGARQMELRQLLGRFIDVCNAMQYAHDRGVVHRDLKPANIMVGKYGETLVVDWGMAKVIGTKEIISDEKVLQPSSGLSSSVQTLPGSAIGTPVYMSPEQAAGKLDELGPSSDVYSLGATLYHILCGKPPLDKGSVVQILQKVIQGEFPPPRSSNPELPRPLEAICLKALTLKPEDRYSNAKSLRDDLEHWLADEPVTAAPESRGERIGRIARRHRATRLRESGT